MFTIDKSLCIGCGACVNDCPTRNIVIGNDGLASLRNKRCISCGHCIAVCPVSAFSCDEYDMNEVIEYDKDSFSIEPDNLLNTIKFRRSVRHYTDEVVTKEQIEQIIEAGRFTASGENRQQTHYMVFQNESINELKEIIFNGLKQSGEAYFAKDPSEQDEDGLMTAKLNIALYRKFVADKEKNDPLFFHAKNIIMMYSNDNYDDKIDVAIAASNLELMANAMGLGACFIGFATSIFDDIPEIAHAVGIPVGMSVTSILTVGYPDVKYYRTVPRKAVDIIWR